ncbi:MAG: hypothetical protein HY982_02045 [Candidatus Magasanikbacteria bacterium]|nr:hypothetical protein [Candidatus Magasanikbacteria bacterium]
MKKFYRLLSVAAIWFLAWPARADEYGLDTAAGGTGLKMGTVAGTIGKVTGAVLSLVGIAFFLLMLYGGFLYMTAQGDESKAKKAIGIVIDAVIGLAIVGASYLITKFVFSAL